MENKRSTEVEVIFIGFTIISILFWTYMFLYTPSSLQFSYESRDRIEDILMWYGLLSYVLFFWTDKIFHKIYYPVLITITTLVIGVSKIYYNSVFSPIEDSIRNPKSYFVTIVSIATTLTVYSVLRVIISNFKEEPPKWLVKMRFLMIFQIGYSQ